MPFSQPTFGPDFPASNKPTPTLTEGEPTKLLLAASKGYPRDYALIAVALYTGLRNAELCHLPISSISIAGYITGTIQVPAAIAKNHHPREIPTHPDLSTILSDFLSWKQTHHQSTEPDDFLFVSRFTGLPLSPRDVQRIIGKLGKSTLHRRITPHMLRHTFATRVLRRSNIRVVQQLLGHLHVSTTQRYTHPSMTDLDLAIRNM